MKNFFIKFLCLGCSFIFLLTSCNTTIKKEEYDFNIDEEEYVIQFSMVGPMLYDHYMFVLTPDNRILAEYVRENEKPQKFQTELSKRQLSVITHYLDQVQTLTEDDIEYSIQNFTDFWECGVYFNDIDAHFSYGASESPAVNLLLELIIGCCAAEESLKITENLHSAPSRFREIGNDFAIVEHD